MFPKNYILFFAANLKRKKDASSSSSEEDEDREVQASYAPDTATAGPFSTVQNMMPNSRSLHCESETEDDGCYEDIGKFLGLATITG